MFGVNGSEVIVLIVVALVVIGPKRLPEYAAMLRDFVKSFRRMAEGAKETVKNDFGEELSAYDWRSLDPRQYDPRRIVREALAEENEAIRKEAERKRNPQTADEPEADPQPLVSPMERYEAQAKLRDTAQAAPFDSEAT